MTATLLFPPPSEDAAHLVHGLEGEATAPDWPALDLESVRRLLVGYGLGKVESIEWASPRPLSAAALVRTQAGVVFVKRHHDTVRPTAALLEEHRFIAYLAARSPLVAPPLTDSEGSTVALDGRWTAEVFAPAAGVDRYRDAHSWTPYVDVEDASAAGEALALLHLAADGYTAEARSPHVLVSSWQVAGAGDPIGVVENRSALCGFLSARAHWRGELTATLEPHQQCYTAVRDDLDPIWMHGDWHPSNLFWNGRVRAVVDFGLCDRGHAVVDLATAIERTVVPWLRIDDPVDTGALRALLDGYERVRPLTAAERTALPAVLPLSQVDFAISEVAYYYTCLSDPGRATYAWESFLLGHAEWWRSAAGDAVLRWISERWEST